MKKYIDIDIFTENNRWSCPWKYSCRFKGLQHGCLQFYLKGTQLQILSCKTWTFAELQFYTRLLTTGQMLLISSNIFDVSLSISAIYQFYINSVTASFLETPDLVRCKWSTLSALKMFKENKKQQVESNILGLKSTQRTKVYVVESAAQGCSAKKVPWNIWQNSQESACTGDFFRINL